MSWQHEISVAREALRARATERSLTWADLKLLFSILKRHRLKQKFREAPDTICPIRARYRLETGRLSNFSIRGAFRRQKQSLKITAESKCIKESRISGSMRPHSLSFSEND